MKKIKLLIAAVITITAFSLHSCGPVEPLDGYVPAPDNTTTPTTPTTPAAAGVFKVDFDGKTFVASTVQALINNDYISISGLKTTGELIQITLPAPFNKVGTYTWKEVSAGGGVMALAYNPSGGSGGFVAIDKNTAGTDFAGYTDTAKVTISKIDVASGKMSGTFEFTGVRYKDPTSGSTAIESKILTNGSFTDIPFTNDVVVTPTKNTFTAKFDGVDYTPVYINGLETLGRINIVARRGVIENIGFSFPNTITSGTTYTLESLGDYRGQYIKNSDITNGIFGGDGSLKIISFDKVNKKIVGTFSFTASSFFISEKHEITDGAFTIFY